MNESDKLRLKAVLHDLGFSTIDIVTTDNQVRLSGRVQGADALTQWGTSMDYILEPHPKWKIDVSRVYCKVPNRGKVYYWRIVLQGTDIVIDEVIEFFSKAHVPVQRYTDQRDPQEVMLVGGRASKGSAGYYGKVLVGPEAIRNARAKG